MTAGKRARRVSIADPEKNGRWSARLAWGWRRNTRTTGLHHRRSPARPRSAYRAEQRSSQIEVFDLDVIAVHVALDRDGQVLSLVCGFQRGGGFLVTFSVELEELALGGN